MFHIPDTVHHVVAVLTVIAHEPTSISKSSGSWRIQSIGVFSEGFQTVSSRRIIRCSIGIIRQEAIGTTVVVVLGHAFSSRSR